MHGRFDELDSLRGLAALSVFFGHIYLIFNENLLTKILFEYGLFRVTVAGSEAVILFFILSGFVLSLPFYSNQKFNYGAYAIKRFCRIYIPYITAILMAIIVRELSYTGKVEGLTNWFNANWSRSLDGNGIINHLLLVGTFTSNLNSVVWSLVHEMRISLVFPFIMFLLYRLNLIKAIWLAIILSIMSVIGSLLSSTPFLGTELFATIHYSAIFIMGALLAKYRENIMNKIGAINMRSKVFLFLIGIILYLYAHPSFVLNMVIHELNPFYRVVMDSWFTSLGAGILISFAISSGKFSIMLKNKFVNYLGKISYSLYLSHITVLFSCIHLLKNTIPMWGICLISIIGTLGVSSVMYHLVEKPSIKLGKLISGSLFKWGDHQMIKKGATG